MIYLIFPSAHSLGILAPGAGIDVSLKKILIRGLLLWGLRRRLRTCGHGSWVLPCSGVGKCGYLEQKLLNCPMSLNESDTRAKPIDPAIHARGWMKPYAHAGCCCVRQWSVPKPSTKSTAWTPTTIRSLNNSPSSPGALAT